MALQGPIAHYHLIKCTALSAAIAHCHFKKQVDLQSVRTFGIRKIYRGNHKKGGVKTGREIGRTQKWEQEGEGRSENWDKETNKQKAMN